MVFLHRIWTKRGPIHKVFLVVYIVNSMLSIPKLTFPEEVLNVTSFKKAICPLVSKSNLINFKLLAGCSPLRKVLNQILEDQVQVKIW